MRSFPVAGFSGGARQSWALAAAILWLAPSAGAVADEPALAFDFGRTIECRDSTPEDFADNHSDMRVIACTLRLSVYLVSGNISDVEAIRVEISDSDRRLRVFGFSPGTQLEAVMGGDVEVSKTTENTKVFGASLGGELPSVGSIAHVTPTLNSAVGNRQQVTEKQKRVAPKQVVVASGTIDGEHGVFFTLRPSPTTSLEGVHELTVEFIVPANWRGDAVRVSCQAAGQQKLLWMKQQKVWAQKSSAVALYIAGDEKARLAAERHVRE